MNRGGNEDLELLQENGLPLSFPCLTTATLAVKISTLVEPNPAICLQFPVSDSLNKPTSAAIIPTQQYYHLWADRPVNFGRRCGPKQDLDRYIHRQGIQN